VKERPSGDAIRGRGCKLSKGPAASGEPCTLYNSGASDVEVCPSVYAVMTDPELRARLAEVWTELAQWTATITLPAY
jgi:hypothetical protein